MASWEDAELWRSRGFRVFPIKEDEKDVPLVAYTYAASDDFATVLQYWNNHPNANIGVALGRGVLVLDVDVKNGKPGNAEFLKLGCPLDTLMVQTPSGGYHCYYQATQDYGNAALAPGVDVRSHHGITLAPGSLAKTGVYTLINDAPIAPLPRHVEMMLKPPSERKTAATIAPDFDAEASAARAAIWLQGEAPRAVQGELGDDTTYGVCCALVRDFGLSQGKALELLQEHYNPRCVPPWDIAELELKLGNAEEYAKGVLGAKTPEAYFGKVQLPAISAISVTSYKPLTSKDNLPACVDEAELAFPEVGNFGNYLPPSERIKTEWVINNFIVRGLLNAIIAPGGVGKSNLALYAAFCIASGHPFAKGFEVRLPGRVVLLNMEDSRSKLSANLEAMCHKYGRSIDKTIKNINFITEQDFPFKLTLDSKGKMNEAHLGLLLRKFLNYEVVAGIFDPFVDIHHVAEQDNTAMSGVMAMLRQFAAATKAGVLFLHHSSKSGLNRPVRHGDAEVSRGAAAIVNATRHAFTLFPLSIEESNERGLGEEDRNRYVRLDLAKTNEAPDLPPLYFHRDVIRQMDGTTIPVFEPHSWECREGEDSETLARLIHKMMIEQGSGTVRLTDLIERWRSEDMLREKMSKDAVTSTVNTLYRRRNAFEYSEGLGKNHKFYRGKEGKYVIFSTVQ